MSSTFRETTDFIIYSSIILQAAKMKSQQWISIKYSNYNKMVFPVDNTSYQTVQNIMHQVNFKINFQKLRYMVDPKVKYYTYKKHKLEN